MLAELITRSTLPTHGTPTVCTQNPPPADLEFPCCVWVHLHQPLLLLPYLLLLLGLCCLHEGRGEGRGEGGVRRGGRRGEGGRGEGEGKEGREGGEGRGEGRGGERGGEGVGGRGGGGERESGREEFWGGKFSPHWVYLQTPL